MFPRFEIFDTGITVYVFGLTLVICFILFIRMLKKLSRKIGIDAGFFLNRMIWFFISVVVFSRLMYIISDWHDMKYIKDPVEFFIMSEYNFSLYGAIIGFLCMLLYSLKANKLKGDKYVDISVLSFLFTAIIGYIGAFFGGQVYGGETNLGIEVLYNNPIVPSAVPLFPLSLVYAIGSFVLFSILYSLFMFINIRGLVGYMGFISFNAMILIGESVTGKYDILRTQYTFINLNQVIAVIFIVISVYKLIKLIKNQPSKTEVISA